MPKPELVRAWRVDLANGLAACGGVLIRFTRCSEQGTEIAFLEGANDCLEVQCELAGEALAAIQQTRRLAGI